MKYSEPRPLIYNTGETLMRKYSEKELETIRRAVRKWKKPQAIYSVYYHVTDKSNIDSILEHGLLPNNIDHCVFLTREVEKLSYYTEKYKIAEPVVLAISALKLNKNLFRESKANHNALYDVVYLDVIPPSVIEVNEE